MYLENRELVEETREVFCGFNANIDTIHSFGVDLDSEGELPDTIRNDKDLHSALSYCMNRGENHEVKYSDIHIEGGEDFIGGQSGIVSNYIAKTGGTPLIYTPYVSEELAELLEEQVLYPEMDDDEFVLKSVKDCAKDSRTKQNHIFEFEGDRTGRLILSDSLKGYGPFLPGFLEKRLNLLEENVDCFFLSGFHDADGNIHAKLEKASRQLEEIASPTHIEYVHDPKTSGKVLESVVEEADSLGLDETELQMICSMQGIECPDEPNLGEAFAALKELKNDLGLERIHLHTYRFHLLLADQNYDVPLERIRNSMLFGELSAIASAEKGEIPGSDDIKHLDFERKHLEGSRQLKEFGDFFDLDDFERKGYAEIDSLKVAAIPVIIHEEPERTVGMGDLISSGSFSMESTYQDS